MARTNLNFVGDVARPAPWAWIVLACMLASAIAGGASWAMRLRSVAQLEQSRLDLIKTAMALREENEKLKASLKRLRAKKRAHTMEAAP